MKFFAIYLLCVSSLFAKPIVDFYGWGSADPRSAYYYTRAYEREHFILNSARKQSHVLLLVGEGVEEVDRLRAEGYEKIVAYLIESRAHNELLLPTRNFYLFLERNLDKFDLILTYDKYLLEHYPEKCKFMHALGFGTLKDHGIHPKSKLCSFFLTTTNYFEGHFMRFEVEKNFRHYFDGFKGSRDPYMTFKDPLLNDFCYSVIIENLKCSHYFSEKLIDCIRAGAVPIYRGCPTIGEFFDLDGLILFDTLDELEEILQNLSFEDYQRRLPAIRRNFEIAAKYPGHGLDLFFDEPSRPDTYDMIWPHIKDYFSQE